MAKDNELFGDRPTDEYEDAEIVQTQQEAEREMHEDATALMSRGNNMTDTRLMVSDSELSVDDVRGQVQKIQQLMKQVMKEGEHYGTIPGAGNKVVLLKAGAEKLGFTFRLIPEFTITMRELPRFHREYEILCNLIHQPSGRSAGQGVGLCTTMESKYRYREDKVEEAMGPVPKSYWDAKNSSGYDEAMKILVKEFGEGKYRTRKVDEVWTVIKVTGTGEKSENPDIADTYNTVLKMAKKRAHVDAMITACAASDIFTQDLEEQQESGPVSPKPKQDPKPKTERKPHAGSTLDVKREAADDSVIRQELLGILEKAHTDEKITGEQYDLWTGKVRDPKAFLQALAVTVKEVCGVPGVPEIF